LFGLALGAVVSALWAMLTDTRNMKKLFIFTLTIGLFLKGYSQDNPDFLLWSSTHKLTIDDFGIKKDNSSSGLSFAQFSMDYSVNGFDFLTRNFNKKVKNNMLKSASWIDTTQNVELSLRYQQTLFDLLEIYTRKFRKELRDNRRQIAKGLSIVQEINSKVSSDFAKRRLEYDKETNSGTNTEKQLIWEQQIRQELLELSDYEYDK
jgi:hypothetical protein